MWVGTQQRERGLVFGNRCFANSSAAESAIARWRGVLRPSPVALLTRTAHISTTFINAAAEGNIEQVELLLRKRVMVDTGNSDGRTAMHLAASEGREHVMKLLIKAEGELGPAGPRWALANPKNLMMLQQLTENSVDVNSGDYDARTALHLAATEGKPWQTVVPSGQGGLSCALSLPVSVMTCQILAAAGHNTVVFIKNRAVKTAYDLLCCPQPAVGGKMWEAWRGCEYRSSQQRCAKPEQEKALLAMLINKLGDSSSKVSSNVSWCIKELLKQHPGMKLPVVKEAEAFLVRPNITAKSQYFALLLLSELSFNQKDGPVASRLVRLFVSQLEAALRKPKLSKKEQLFAVIEFSLCWRLLYEQIGNFDFFSSSHSWQAFMLLQILVRFGKTGAIQKETVKLLDSEFLRKCVPADASCARGVALARRLLMEMAPLMHTVDRKVVPAEAEGNAAEEEHFVDDDVALAAAKDAPEDQHISAEALHTPHFSTETHYDPLMREPRFARARNAPFWELQALSGHVHPTVSHYAQKLLRAEAYQELSSALASSAQVLQDGPTNPFDVFSVSELLEQFAYHSRVKRERKTGKKLDTVKSTIMNSEAFLKRKTVQPHERLCHHAIPPLTSFSFGMRHFTSCFFGCRFFKTYFTDPKVRKEQERKRKASKKDVDDVDEEEEDGEEADDFFDNYLKGEMQDDMDDMDDDEDDDDDDLDEDEEDLEDEGTSDESEAGVFCEDDDDEDEVVKITAKGKKDCKHSWHIPH
eukprot:Skav219980  [mRNA]  locus=scaffold137:52766:68938:- [translate_table: standard]